MANKVTIGKLEDDCMDIVIDGVVAGWLERVNGEDFRSASSRARKTFVSHYSVNLTDDTLDSYLKGQTDFPSKSDAKKAIEAACASYSHDSTH